MAQRRPAIVAVFNSSEDIVDMLRVALEHAGFLVVTGHIPQAVRGQFDLPGFVDQHQPQVVVYDIAPPYERNWQFLLHLRELPQLRDRRFVLTSTHSAHVRNLVGTDAMIHEILGKPYDIEAIVQAVKEALPREDAPG